MDDFLITETDDKGLLDAILSILQPGLFKFMIKILFGSNCKLWKMFTTSEFIDKTNKQDKKHRKKKNVNENRRYKK